MKTASTTCGSIVRMSENETFAHSPKCGANVSLAYRAGDIRSHFLPYLRDQRFKRLFHNPTMR